MWNIVGKLHHKYHGPICYIKLYLFLAHISFVCGYVLLYLLCVSRYACAYLYHKGDEKNAFFLCRFSHILHFLVLFVIFTSFCMEKQPPSLDATTVTNKNNHTILSLSLALCRRSVYVSLRRIETFLCVVEKCKKNPNIHICIWYICVCTVDLSMYSTYEHTQKALRNCLSGFVSI